MLIKGIIAGLESMVNLLDCRLGKDSFNVILIGNGFSTGGFVILGKSLMNELFRIGSCGETFIDFIICLLDILSWDIKVGKTGNVDVLSL